MSQDVIRNGRPEPCAGTAWKAVTDPFTREAPRKHQRMTTEDHPDPKLLERFMRNEAGAPERRAVVRHLLAGCSRCVAVTRHFWSLGEAATYAGVLTRLEDRGAQV